MSEVGNDIPAPVEKESGAVKKMAERVGKFLSETYTFSGAKTKELQGFEGTITAFTPAQQREMRAYFETKAENNAKWKVIRNWVVTGAGLTLGTAILANPSNAVNFVIAAGNAVITWWHQAAAAVGGSMASMQNWLFDKGNPIKIPMDVTKAAHDYNTYGLGAWMTKGGKAVTDTVTNVNTAFSNAGTGMKAAWEASPFLLMLKKGPQFRPFQFEFR